MSESAASVAVKLLKFILSFYYLFSISFRVSFRYNATFTSNNWIVLLIDYLTDLLFLVDYLLILKRRFSYAVVPLLIHEDVDENLQIAPPRTSSYRIPDDNGNATLITDRRKQVEAFERLLAQFEIQQRADAARKAKMKKITLSDRIYQWFQYTLEVLMIFPFEIIGYLCGYHLYFHLRSFRVLRMWHLKAYWRDIVHFMETNNLVTGASGHRVVALTVFMLVLAHLGACIFYIIGLAEMERADPATNNWMTADGMTVWDETTKTYYHTRSLRYRYVRAIYWAVVTSQTVGFGDVGPHTMLETSYCLVYFYMSHVLAQTAIGNLILLVNVYDSARTKYRQQMDKLDIYAQFRSLPLELKDRIGAFYLHQWKVLNGLDETNFLMELPHNIETKVKQSTVRDFLKNVPQLKNLRIYILNALAEDVKAIMYAPHDVIVPAGSQSKGMYIISRGEAFVHTRSEKNGSKEANGSGDIDAVDSFVDSPVKYEEEDEQPEIVISQALRQGEAYGSKSLTHKFEFASTLSAGGGVCEVLFLSRSRFRRTLRFHMTDDEFRRAIPNNPLLGGGDRFSTSRAGTGPSTHTEANPGSSDEKRRKKNHSQIRAAIFQVETKSRRVDMFKPESPFRNTWDLFIFFALIFYSITIPYLLSVCLDPKFFEIEMPLLVCCFFVDAVFVVNLVFRAFYFSFFRASVLFTKPHDIFENFCRHNNYVLEVLSVIPFEIVAVHLGTSFIPLLRLFKIYQLISIVEYGDRTERIFTANFSMSLSFAARRFIKLYIALFELCHWSGCLWQLTADVSTQLLGYDTNWKIQDRDSAFLHMNYPTLYGSSAYRRSIYWAVNAMSTAGVADMLSSNLLEMMFCSFVLILGCQTINAVMGSIASLMGNINMEKRNFHNKMVHVQKIIKFRNIPPDIERRIIYFFEYQFSRTSGANEVEVLQGLPQPLREEVVKYVAGSVLVKIPFFSDCIEPMLEMILGLLSHRLFLEGDDLMTAGEHGREMFVIESGTIVVTSADKKVIYATLGSGSYIGESCLLKVAKRTASAHARDYSDTYVLNKEDFQKVLEAFPGEGELVVEGIEAVLDEKRRKNEEMTRLRREQAPSSKAEEKTEEKPESGDQNDSPLQPKDKPVAQDGEKEKKAFNWRKELETGSRSRRIWDSFLFLILMYNLVMIPFRIALEVYPPLYGLDFAFDVVLLLDSYMHSTWFRLSVGGKHIADPVRIKDAYMKNDFKQDLLARFPWDIFILFFMGQSARQISFIMPYLRIPKLILLLKGVQQLASLESLLEETNLTFVSMRMLQVILACLLVGHWLGCGLYLFAYANAGPCENEPGALYGNACEFRNTWVQFQIMNDKLHSDGGSQISRYLRAVNWAIPIMVLYTVGDVYPMNVNESSYVFGAMFFGISINALIIGSIIALVSTLDEELTGITTKSDLLRDHLKVNNIDISVIHKVTAFMNYLLTDTGQMLMKEEAMYAELPHTLQVAVSSHTKLGFFKQCPFFDFCSDEVLRNLCMVMKPEIFYTGDMIISFGDLGQEMYFIERGTVEVLSADGKTKYATLQEGGFFGETGLVFRSRRTANIRATSLCVCYSITKDDLDDELRDCEFDVEATIQSLVRLQDGNARRNQAVTKNLKIAGTDGTKLNKILGTVSSGERAQFIENLARPTGIFKTIVDIFGLLALLYYAFSIPFIVTYIFGEAVEVYRRRVMPFDFCIDGLVFVELLLRLFFFTTGFQGATDVGKLYHNRSDMMWDIVGSIPLELFVLLPNVSYESILALRLIHLTRLGNVFGRVNQVEKHLQRMGMTFHRTTIMLFFSLASYFLINHWSACIYSATHRYLERKQNSTWVIQDGYSSYKEVEGQHDVCSRDLWSCYQRSMYFVGTVLTSVGYGDINVYTDTEMIMQVMLAIIGACAGANLSGQISAYLQTGDKSGLMAFKEKMRSVENYCNYRGLKVELKSSILTNYRTMWRNERRLGGAKSSFLSALSKPLAETVALELNRDMMKTTPLLKTVRKSLHGRIALAMKPQILLPNYPVYSVGDSGHCVFFVQSGKVIIKTASSGELLDTISVGTLRILERKQEFTGGLYTLGTHFGEFCVMSKLGLRSETATPSEITEVLYYEKDDIWALFIRMPYTERYRFLQSLFTEVGGIPHSKDVTPSPQNDALMEGVSIKNMYKLAAVVADDILATYGNEDNSDEESLATATIKQEALARRISVMSNDGSDASGDKPTDMSKWSEALKAYDKTRLRRKSSRLSSSKTIMSGRSLAPSVPDDSFYEEDEEDPDDLVALERRIRALFAYIDKDGSGSIDKNELMLSLLDLGIERSWADVDSMIDFADKDGDAEVDLEELVAAIMRELKKEADAKRMAEEKMDAISDLDDEDLGSVGEGAQGEVPPVDEYELDKRRMETESDLQTEECVATSGERGQKESVSVYSSVKEQGGTLASTTDTAPGEIEMSNMAVGGKLDTNSFKSDSPTPFQDSEEFTAGGAFQSTVDLAAGDTDSALDQLAVAVDPPESDSRTERMSSPVEQYEDDAEEVDAAPAPQEVPGSSEKQVYARFPDQHASSPMNVSEEEKSDAKPSSDTTDDLNPLEPSCVVARKESIGWLNPEDVLEKDPVDFKPRRSSIERKLSEGVGRRQLLPSLSLDRKESDVSRLSLRSELLSSKGLSGQGEEEPLAAHGAMAVAATEEDVEVPTAPPDEVSEGFE